jgi:hypothetical protein
VNAGEEVPRGFLIAGGDGSEVFDDIEEALDQIALGVKCEVTFPLGLAVGPWRNDRFDPAHFKMLDEGIAVVALVADERGGIDGVGQGLGLRHVMNMPAGEADRQRIAERIDDDMDLGRQSAARAPDRFVRIPLFRAPALC